MLLRNIINNTVIKQIVICTIAIAQLTSIGCAGNTAGFEYEDSAHSSVVQTRNVITTADEIYAKDINSTYNGYITEEVVRIDKNNKKSVYTPDYEYYPDIDFSGMNAKAKNSGIYTAGGRPLYENNAEERISLASTTKIITAATALKYLPIDTVLTVGKEITLVHSGSSLCYLKQGQQLTLYDALHGLLLPSGNDAAYTIAVNTTDYILGENSMTSQEKVDYFCNLMTETAKEYGAVNSHFATPDGWDHIEHYTTVRDLANIFAGAMKIEVFREVVSKTTYTTTTVSGHKMSVSTTNPTIKNTAYYRDCVIGGKTGYTGGAGRCLIIMMEHNGLEYIVVGMGFADNASRNKCVVKMVDYIQANAG